MIISRWCAQLAAIWHWYLPFCIYISFLELSPIPACFSLMCSINKDNTDGTNSMKMCLMFVDVCFVLWMHRDWLCSLTWEKDIYIWEEFWNVNLLITEFVVLRWHCVVDRTLTSNYCLFQISICLCLCEFDRMLKSSYYLFQITVCLYFLCCICEAHQGLFVPHL